MQFICKKLGIDPDTGEAAVVNREDCNENGCALFDKCQSDGYLDEIDGKQKASPQEKKGTNLQPAANEETIEDFTRPSGEPSNPLFLVTNDGDPWDEENLSYFTEKRDRIRTAIFNDKGKMLKPDHQFATFDEDQSKDKFLLLYAKAVWPIWFQQNQEEGEKDLLRFIPVILEKDKAYLQGRGYSERTVNTVIGTLRKDLERQVKRLKDGADYKTLYYPHDSPESRLWTQKVDEAIMLIRNLYLEFTPLKSDRSISFNMACAFDAIGFLTHERKSKKKLTRLEQYQEHIRKVIQRGSLPEIRTPMMDPIEKKILEALSTPISPKFPNR